MLLVVCGLEDESALWFARRAAQSGVHCRIVTTEALSYARRFSHRLVSGEVRTVVQLADGPPLADSEISGVLNRAVQAPAAAWQLAAPAERDYATMEWHAGTLSWLHALPCPVRNRPEPDCLAGPVRHPFVMVAAAQAAGSQARPVHLACLDGAVPGGDLPEPVAAGIAAFAARVNADTALLGLDFFAGVGGWWFAGASPLPDLRAGGDALCRRLLDLLAPDQVPVPS